MKIIGFNAGMRGDLVMNTVACRAAKQKWPDCYLTFGIGKPFEDMAPLFEKHPHIDKIHIWESYGGLTEGDKKYIEEEKFDKIFNPMPEHKSSNWYNEVKCQTEEVCRMHDLEPPEDLSCYLEKWFKPVRIKKTINIVPFTAHEPKNMSIGRWYEIINYIHKKGYTVTQLSSYDQPKLQGIYQQRAPYFNTVHNALFNDLLITLDSGMSWVASAYKLPVLGLYGWHYPNQKSSKSYQPINPNAIYLEAAHANEIPMEEIFETIDKMLK
jgi:ADP-heptose:LPS heptosyltransferase